MPRFEFTVGMHELTKKISLSRSLSLMQKLFPDDFDFYPETWILPNEWSEFEASASLLSNKNYWYISKPDAGAQVRK